MGFGQIVNNILIERGMSAAELSRKLGWNTGVLSQYMNNPDRSPKLSTALKVAQALDVSLDYLAGVDDQPSHFYADPMTMRMVDGFQKLPYKGKQAMLEQLDFQLSKSGKAMPNNTVPGVA